MAPPERLFDVAVVARICQVTSETVRNWIRAGKVQAIHEPNGFYKIPASELQRLKDTRAQDVQAPMSLDEVKELARLAGYTFTVDSDGTERMIRPDGSVALIARRPKESRESQ